MNYIQYNHTETYSHAKRSGVFPFLLVQDGLHEQSSTRYCTDFRYPNLQENMNINGLRISSQFIGPVRKMQVVGGKDGEEVKSGRERDKRGERSYVVVYRLQKMDVSI